MFLKRLNSISKPCDKLAMKFINISKIREPSINDLYGESEFIQFKKGDILAYHGNLSYYLKCMNDKNGFIFLHLVDGRGSKWEHDNLYYYY